MWEFCFGVLRVAFHAVNRSDLEIRRLSVLHRKLMGDGKSGSNRTLMYKIEV